MNHYLIALYFLIIAVIYGKYSKSLIINYNLNDTINPICPSGREPVTTFHCLLSCDFYFTYRLELLKNICALNSPLNNILEENLV